MKATTPFVRIAILLLVIGFLIFVPALLYIQFALQYAEDFPAHGTMERMFGSCAESLPEAKGLFIYLETGFSVYQLPGIEPDNPCLRSEEGEFALLAAQNKAMLVRDRNSDTIYLLDGDPTIEWHQRVLSERLPGADLIPVYLPE